jgi:hypothetical protein
MLDPQSQDLRDHITRVGPPTSLQVCIRDAEQLQTLRLDVFHVVLPDIREPNSPCHLLGLRGFADIACESTMQKEPPPSHAFTEPSAAEVKAAAALRQTVDTDAKSASSNGSSERSAGSKNSRDSRKTCKLPQIAQVDVMVVMEPNGSMPIESIAINFDLKVFEGIYSSQRPDLQHWLLGSACHKHRPWLEAQTNHYVYKETCQKLGRLSLRTPIGDSKAKLIASDVTMAWADEDEDDGKMRALLEFRSLSELRHSKSSKGVTELWQPMAIIDERR